MKASPSQTESQAGILFSPEEAGEEYKRHRITKSGVSPRAFSGQKGAQVATDADEHDEAGHLIEDAETRTQMMQKADLKRPQCRTVLRQTRLRVTFRWIVKC